MSIHLQPPVPLVTLVKTKTSTVIKYEPLESEIVEIGIDDIRDSSESEEEIISDVKDIDIVYHPVCEDPIKSEILESKHCESIETQVLVKAENSPFIKAENITQRNKSEDASDGNVSRSTGHGVIEVQASNEHSNSLSNLETDVLNFSKNLNINVRSRKFKSPKKTDFAECYKTDDTTLWKKEKEKIKVIKAPVIPVEAHEYTSLAQDRHACNHCQYACNILNNLKRHIKKGHREVTTMYQCPYCPFKSKWREYIINQHIIQKHKDTKDIQWFQCNLCEMKFKLKKYLVQHNMKVHLKHKQMQDGLDLCEKRYHCDNCDYKTKEHYILKNHKIIHLKPEEIEYFYCYHCSHKYKYKSSLKIHIFRHHFKNVKREKRYHCDTCDYKTYAGPNLKNHKIIHLKPEEIEYLYCYHCSHKYKYKSSLKIHIFRHHFKNVKREKRQYFYCYHCSYKTNQKGHLKKHIFRHFKKEQVEFDCYICNFMTPKRESIIKHIKKHSKVQNKSEINEGS